jgi:hypothetical protein
MDNAYNGRKVSIARLHTILHVPGLGQLGPAVTPDSGKLLGSATLTKVPDGLMFVCKGIEVFVPNGNIISMQLVPE